MIDPNTALDRMREWAYTVQANRENESPEAIGLADYFLQLDAKLCKEPDFPYDWRPF